MASDDDGDDGDDRDDGERVVGVGLGVWGGAGAREMSEFKVEVVVEEVEDDDDDDDDDDEEEKGAIGSGIKS